MSSVSEAAPESLWSKDYVFDIGINFLVYSVHFLLMLWSTAYAIHTWNASIGMAGLASGLFIVGALFARIPAGRFIDFVGRRKMFLGGTSMFFLLVLCYELAPTLSVFMVVRFLHGLAFGTTSTAASTVVAALVPLKRMGTGIGYFTLGVTLASAIGPFMAMNITQAGDFSLGIEICTVTTFVIFLLSFFISFSEQMKYGIYCPLYVPSTIFNISIRIRLPPRISIGRSVLLPIAAWPDRTRTATGVHTVAVHCLIATALPGDFLRIFVPHPL